jgi:hypothetical protein
MNVNKKVIIAGARCFCIIMMLLQLVMLFFFLDQKVLPMSAVSGVSFFAFLLCVVLLEKENFYGFTVLLPTILLFYAGCGNLADRAYQRLSASVCRIGTVGLLCGVCL